MLLLTACAALAAQTLSPISTRGVKPDGSVHFELKAPNAQKVALELEGTDEQPMTKGADGTWTLDTKPLAPDLYGYSFSVDGVSALDPLCPTFKPNLIWQSNMILVPGAQPELWEEQDVPRGRVDHHFYKSGVIGDNRDYFVYTPPGYDPKAREKYPVLYLLHGYSDMASGWTEVGRANVILDNLIAQQKVHPMLIVMTLGYGVPGFASPGGKGFSDRSVVKENYDKYREALMTEVIPAVERDYSVSKDKKDRAIAGLSMGGAETLYTGLNLPDKFSYVGAFSSGGLSDQFDEDFPGLQADKVNKELKLLYVACGTDDGLIKFNRNLVTWLKGKSVDVQAVETPGRHAWMVWRRDLIDFSQKLFR